MDVINNLKKLVADYKKVFISKNVWVVWLCCIAVGAFGMWWLNCFPTKFGLVNIPLAFIVTPAFFGLIMIVYGIAAPILSRIILPLLIQTLLFIQSVIEIKHNKA